jgi:transposase
MSPLSGVLGADFASFFDACQKAEVSLTVFESGGAKVEQRLNKVSDAFSGKKIIQEATLIAEIFQRAGGAATFTAKELERMGAVGAEAAAKLRALGQDVPPGIQRIAAEAKGAADAGGVLGSTFTQMFGAISAASLASRAGQVLVGLATDALATADTLVNLSNKTGLSTDTLQRMQFVAKQSGTDMTVFADAAFKMGVNIAEGTGKARKGAEDLGLSWKALRAASPDQQFAMVVQALEQMEDPQKRNEAAVALFGKTAKEILPAIVDGYSKVAGAATVAGDAQIRALDAAGDAYDRMKTRINTGFVQALGTAGLAAEEASKRGVVGWLAFFNVLAGGQEVLAALHREMAKDVNLKVEKALPPGFVDELKAAQAAYLALTAEERANLKAALELGKSNDEIINSLGLTEATLALVKKAWQEEATASTKATAEIKKNLDEREKGFIQSAALQTKLIDEVINNQRRAGATANELQRITLDNQMAAEIAAARANTKATQQEIDTSVGLIKLKYKGLVDEIGFDWAAISGASQKSADEQRDDALKTYTYMIEHADQFTHGALDRQLQKYRDLRDAATASGRAAADGQDAAAAAAEKHNKELDEQRKITEAILAANEALIRSRTASFEVTASNFSQTVTQSAGGAGRVQDAMALANEGYSFTEILAILRGGQKFKPVGPRIPGFKDGVENFSGGMAIVGDGGPEVVNLPRGSSVTTADDLRKQLADWDRELMDVGRITQARTDEILSLYSGVRNQLLALEGLGMKSTLAEQAKLKAQGYDVGADGLTTGRSKEPALLTRPGAAIPLEGRGAGHTVTVNQYITGVIDKALARQLAKSVGDELMETLKIGKQLGAA